MECGKKGWTLCQCSSKLLLLVRCKFVTVVRRIGVVIGSVVVFGCIYFVDGVIRVVVGVADFAGFTGVTGLVDSGVSVVGLDDFGLVLLMFDTSTSISVVK